jgi:hypothetical protein
MSPRRKSVTRALAVVAASIIASGPLAADAGAVVRHHTRAGNALARRVLLSRRDLGRGWSSGAPPRSAPPLTCPTFDPLLRGETEIGAAATARFEQPAAGGLFVSQVADTYATAGQGAAAARGLIRPGLIRCLAASLTGGSTAAIHFAVTRRGRLGLPRLGVDAAGYRVSGTASQPYQIVPVYLDAIVLAHGQTITEVSFASFETPPPRALELRLARLLAHRLLAGHVAAAPAQAGR